MKPPPPLDLRRLLADVASAVQDHNRELDALDAAVGDGDHGTTVARGFARAAVAVASAPSDDPGHLLQVAGRALLTIGGASGPLFATIFIEAGAAVEASESALTAATVAAMLTAAADGVRRRGGAARGDKTLYDALDPAASAARDAASRHAAGSGDAVAAVLSAAAAAARAGAEATREMVGRQGRARFVGQRSLGHADPGATTVAIILETIARHCTPLNTA